MQDANPFCWWQSNFFTAPSTTLSEMYISLIKLAKVIGPQPPFDWEKPESASPEEQNVDSLVSTALVVSACSISQSYCWGVLDSAWRATFTEWLIPLCHPKLRQLWLDPPQVGCKWRCHHCPKIGPCKRSEFYRLSSVVVSFPLVGVWPTDPLLWSTTRRKPDQWITGKFGNPSNLGRTLGSKPTASNHPFSASNLGPILGSVRYWSLQCPIMRI